MIEHAVTPQTFRERQMLALARRKGLTFTPWGRAGSVRLAGPGVDVIFSALRFVQERDFALRRFPSERLRAVDSAARCARGFAPSQELLGMETVEVARKRCG